MSARVVVLQHEDACPPDRLGPWLAQAGLAVEVCRPYAGDALPDPGPALVVLGGRMGAGDDEDAPWLPATRALLARAAQDGTPVLGVCLGAQLLAAGCGGRVERGADGLEAGVVDVRWRAEAAGDPLVGGLPDPHPGPSMHRDAVVELPPGAVWLGRSAQYPHQVFRVGERAWGVQFHPEVTVPTFRTWAAGHGRTWAERGTSAEQVVGQLADRDGSVAAAGWALAEHFADVVRSTAPVADPTRR